MFDSKIIVCILEYIGSGVDGVGGVEGVVGISGEVGIDEFTICGEKRRGVEKPQN